MSGETDRNRARVGVEERRRQILDTARISQPRRNPDMLSDRAPEPRPPQESTGEAAVSGGMNCLQKYFCCKGEQPRPNPSAGIELTTLSQQPAEPIAGPSQPEPSRSQRGRTPAVTKAKGAVFGSHEVYI